MSGPDVRDLEITAAHAMRTAIEQLKVAKDAAVLWANAADAEPSQLRPLYRALFELQTEYQYWLPIEPGHLRDTAPESPAATAPGVTTPADPDQAAHGAARGQESGSEANDTRVVRPGHTLIVAESEATTWEPKLRCDGAPGDLQRDCTAWIPCGCDWDHRADPCPVSPTGRHEVLLDDEPMRPTARCLLETETAAHAAAVDLVDNLRLPPGSYPVAWVGDEYGYALRLVGGES